MVGHAMDGFCGWRRDAACALPRSCFDCLNGADTATCGINAHGACVDVSTTQPVIFAASEVTYCRDDDPVCAASRRGWEASVTSFDRREERQLLGETSTGVKGCVCMALCHDAQRTAALRNQSEWCALGLVSSVFVAAAPTLTTLAPVPVEALRLEGMSQTGSTLYVVGIFAVPIVLMLCCCWGVARCIGQLGT